MFKGIIWDILGTAYKNYSKLFVFIYGIKSKYHIGSRIKISQKPTKYT